MNYAAFVLLLDSIARPAVLHFLWHFAVRILFGVRLLSLQDTVEIQATPATIRLVARLGNAFDRLELQRECGLLRDRSWRTLHLPCKSHTHTHTHTHT